MNFLYRITHTIIIWLFPVLLVLTSFVIMLPAKAQHKAAIAYGGFYPELSRNLQNPPSQESYSTESLILRAAFENLATPDWLKGVVNTNIDNFVDWLTSSKSTWNIYLPNEEIQSNVSKTLDNQVDQILDDPTTTVTPCDAEKSQDIRSNGLKLDGDFCLPPSVISGEQSLTEFMGIKDESLSKNFFNSLLAQNPLNSDTLSVGKLFPDSQFVSSLNSVRALYTWLAANLIFIWLFFLAFILAHLLISKAADKTFLGQIQKIFMLTGINTLILSLVIVLFVAGGNYLTSSVVKFILPGLVINQIQNIILFRIVLLVAGLLEIAIGSAVVLIVARIGLSVLKNMGIIGSVDLKNKHLQANQTNIKKNPTHDGEFRRSIEPEAQDDGISLNPINHLAADTTVVQNAQMHDTHSAPEQDDAYAGYNPFDVAHADNLYEHHDQAEIHDAIQNAGSESDDERSTPPVIVNIPKDDSSRYDFYRGANREGLDSDSEPHTNDTDATASSSNTPQSSNPYVSVINVPQKEPAAEKQVETEIDNAPLSQEPEEPQKPTISDTGANKKIRGL